MDTDQEGKKEEAKEEATSIVEQILDGVEAPHSPEDAGNASEPPRDEPPAKADSGEDAGKDGAEANETQVLQAALERLDKRLKDTQRRLHDECARRAELQKELDSMQEDGGGDADDDWFADKAGKSDRRKEVEKELADSDERLRQLDEETRKDTEDANVQRWDQAAALVERQHPDFKEKVYGYLGDFIDEQSGKYDAAIHKSWLRQEDKSPAGAYKFATELKRKLEYLDNPDKLRDEIRREIETGSAAPTGRVGLDMVNSASGPSSGSGFREEEGFVEQLFK